MSPFSPVLLGKHPGASDPAPLGLAAQETKEAPQAVSVRITNIFSKETPDNYVRIFWRSKTPKKVFLRSVLRPPQGHIYPEPKVPVVLWGPFNLPLYLQTSCYVFFLSPTGYLEDFQDRSMLCESLYRFYIKERPKKKKKKQKKKTSSGWNLSPKGLWSLPPAVFFGRKVLYFA